MHSGYINSLHSNQDYNTMRNYTTTLPNKACRKHDMICFDDLCLPQPNTALDVQLLDKPHVLRRYLCPWIDQLKLKARNEGWNQLAHLHQAYILSDTGPCPSAELLRRTSSDGRRPALEHQYLQTKSYAPSRRPSRGLLATSLADTNLHHFRIRLCSDERPKH